jgi:hypothetical protein
MPRDDAYDLSDAEKRDLIKLIEKGKPLPEKYRFLLFADKREVELVWNGKSREVCTAILPFQTLEHIDEPRKEKRDDEELGLDTGGRQVKGWTNKLIWGDNKLKRGASRVDVLAFEFEMGLVGKNSPVLGEAQTKGVDLALKTIPGRGEGPGALPRRGLHRSHAAFRS